MKENKEQEEKFEELVEVVENTEIINDDEEKEQNENKLDLTSLYKINNDLVGWLKIENTNINYPIMQRQGNSNFYLRRNFYKEYSQWGTPFLAENCNINTSDNLIVYGHHIKGNKMFGELENYKNKEYFNNHSIIKLYTKEDYKEYEIVYVFRTIAQTGFKYYNYINLDNENDFKTFIGSCEKLKLYNTGKEVNYGDKFITLSTCDYTLKNGRFVVVGRKIKNETKNDEQDKKEEQKQIEEVNKKEEKEQQDATKLVETQIIKENKTIKNDNKTISKTKVTSTYNQEYFSNGHLKSYPSFSSKYATLKISKLNINAPVYFGVNQEILVKGVAHDSGSYFCGENGTIIMCGHNFMNSFKRFGELKNGNLIEIKTDYGDFFYKIYNAKVIKDTELDELPIQHSEEKLMIYTCYPFQSTGYTEYRYVLYANKI